MIRRDRVSRLWSVLVLVACMPAVWACEDRQPTPPGIDAARSGSTTSGDPSVSAVAPDSATLDTTLDVTVTGSNFDQGSRVDLALAGVVSDSVRTNQTRFVNSRKLVANVTIAAGADTGKYDVVVTASTGKKGIGTELFAIKTKAQDTPIAATYRDATSDGVLSDAQLRPGLDPTYIDAIDGVDAKILAIGNYRVTALNGTSTRKFCFDFHGQDVGGLLPNAFCDNGYQATSSPDVAGGLPAMTPGSTMTTASQVTWVMNGYNWFLRFGLDCNGNPAAGKRITVTRSADGATWTMTTPAVPAWLCHSPVKGKPSSSTVGQFTMPYQVTVHLK
jgi:hypothetical protein